MWIPYKLEIMGGFCPIVAYQEALLVACGYVQWMNVTTWIGKIISVICCSFSSGAPGMIMQNQ
jgi:hypothetical protein